MGYGIIEIKSKDAVLLSAGVLKLDKFDNQALKLKRIFERTLSLIDDYKPDELAIEAPFFGKNVQSMLKLGRAQGVALAAALYRSVPVTEYSPKKIKQSVTGNGNASKEQVASMLQSLLKFKDLPRYLDATDALGAAYCHYLQKNGILGVSRRISRPGGTGWKAFISANPEKLI